MKSFIKNNYLFFRLGHATIGMLLQLVNFIVITHALFLTNIIDLPIYIFALVFISGYAVVCIFIGKLQLHKQLPTDHIRIFENNPIAIRMQLLHFKMLAGIASDKEIKDMIVYLERLQK